MRFFKQHTALALLIATVAISFAGSIPPGTTNVLTLQLAAINRADAIWFSVGCVFAEMIYVGFCLFMIDKLMQWQKVLKLMSWICFGILIILAIGSFAAAILEKPLSGAAWVANGSPFAAGFLLMIINPVQIPFWLAWTTILVDRKILLRAFNQFLVCIAGAGIGSIIASVLFVVAGETIAEFMKASHRTFNFLVGVFFIFSAIFQLRKILSPKKIEMASDR